MTTQVSGTTGINRVQDGTVAQADLAANVAGNGPAFSAAQSIGTSAANNIWTLIGYQNESYDSNNNYDPGTGKFQPTVPGWYSVGASLSGPASATGVSASAIYKNGFVAAFGPVNNNNMDVTVSVAHTLLYLNGPTDYVQVYGRQTTGGTIALTNYGVFHGVLARAA